MAHLRPLENSEIADEEILARFEHYAQTRGFTPNSIRTMARRPAVVKAFMALNQAILYEGSVSEQLKMLISLACSFSAGCLYCQSHMTNLAHIYDAPSDKIGALLDFEDSELFSDAEKAALNVAFKGGAVPNQARQEDFDRLAEHFTEGEVVEIVASIALFGFLNRWNDTMATTLEPLPAGRASDLIGAIGWQAGKHG